MAVQAPPETSQSVPESTPETPSKAAEPPLDVIFEILSNQRRRFVLRYLLSESETTTLGDLAEHIASIENDKPESALSSAERKRVYICLYQCHLPKMDDANAINFDENRKTVEVAENIEHMTKYLTEKNSVESAGEGDGWTTGFEDLAQALGRRLRTLTTPEG